MEEQKYARIQSYGSMSTRSDNEMIVHSQLFPYSKKMVVENEILYEQEHPPFQPLFAVSKLLGKARFTSLLVIYVVFYVAYVVSGALVFAALEVPVENQLRLNVIRAKQAFMAKNPGVLDDDLEALLEEVVSAAHSGVSAAKNFTSGHDWSFGQSLTFSSSVITTIGYGRVTPLSKEGKIFCIIYALVGIPLTLILLTAFVECLLLPTTAMLKRMNASLGHLYRPFTIRIMHLAIIVVFVVVVFVLIPASGFMMLEQDWDYLDSIYYCFISLTTIGLGDFIPGDLPDKPYWIGLLYKIFTIVYLIAGLSFLMLTLTVFYDIPQLNISTVFSSAKVNEDPERIRLSSSGVTAPGYGIGGLEMQDDDNRRNQRRSVVLIRPHRQESPSPEDTTPVHAQDMRVH